ncbi:hypothetical protein K438DRAFT_1758456 [Mycena galopus ATCC 62051]|nr:hypothetical protein K438DRAFT_1758456 [Mycena galopus ATCC 62051]
MPSLGCPSWPKSHQVFILGRNDNCLDLPLRWNQLTSLSLFPSWDVEHLQTPKVVLNILSTCPKLHTGRFPVDDSVDGFVADDIVECPSLRSVDLLCFGGAPLAQRLLNHLSMPNLEQFRLRGATNSLPSWGVSIDESIGSSLAAFPRLNSISIDSEAFTKASLMDFVSTLSPTIQSLYITEQLWNARSEPVLDDEVLVTLAAHGPALRELIILNCLHVTDDALLRFIISGTPTLRRVQVKFERERQVDILPSIQLFVDDGLECNTMYTSHHLLRALRHGRIA